MLKYFTLIYFSLIGLTWAYSDSNLCVNAIKHFQKKYSIPHNYLYKIALVETGRYDKSGCVVNSVRELYKRENCSKVYARNFVA